VESSPHPVRVGLAHGAVVGLYGDYYGETVNLAARLVRATTPSTVLTSETVRDRAGTAFSFQPLDPFTLKGFAEPVRAYAIRRA
jgi:class 3 adenylate cyclase